jgi:putative membrane protein
MSQRRFRTFQAFLMFGLGFFLLERFWSGRLALYINQRFTWLILLASFGLMAFGLITFNHRPPIWTQEERLLAPEMASKNARWRLLIFTIPLLLGILIPATSLGASAAETRGVSQAVPLSAGGSIPSVLTLAPANRSILEWLWAFDAAEDPTDFIGQQVDVEGFVFIIEKLPDGYFMVGRFIVTCCVADATAIGIAFLPPEGADVPNGWVRIQGEMTVTTINEQPALLIEAHQVTPMDEPEQPYLYP